MNSLDAYEYDLPQKHIAFYPRKERASSRMLVLNKESGETDIRNFKDILNYLSSGDCLVLNNTKVIKARVFGLKEGEGAKIEALLINSVDKVGKTWNCFLKPGKRVKEGTRVKLICNSSAELDERWYTVVKKNVDSSCEICFDTADVLSVLDNYGSIPLPPYIKRPTDKSDEIRYQTVYSKVSGAVAAPTAGLHFTDEILNAIKLKGINIAELTLHVGAGTFQPVSVDDINMHKMHSEEYFISEETAELINSTKKNGNKIIAVGTTSTRVLETVADEYGLVKAGCGWTDIFLYPPYRPKVVDILLTNFHLPKSTLLMLVSCFAGRKNILSAYKKAIDENFFFYSYGDCMLIK